MSRRPLENMSTNSLVPNNNIRGVSRFGNIENNVQKVSSRNTVAKAAAPAQRKKQPTTVSEWKAEAERLKSKGLQFKADLEESQQKLVEYSAENTELLSKIEQNDKSIEELRAKIAILEEEIQRQNNRGTELQSKVAQKEEMISRLNTEMDKLREDNLAFREEKYQSDLRIQKYQHEIKQQEELASQLAAALATVKRQQEALLNASEKIDEFKIEISRVTDEKYAETKKVENLRKELSDLQVTLGQVQQNNSLLELEKSKILSRSHQLDINKSELEEQKLSLESQITQLRSEIRQLQESLQTMEGENVSLTQSKHSLQQDRNNLLEANEALDRGNTVLQAEIRKASQNVSALEEEKDTLTSEKEKFQQALLIKEGECEQLKTDLCQLQTQLSSLEKEKDQLSLQFTQRSSAYDELDKEHNQLKALFDEIVVEKKRLEDLLGDKGSILSSMEREISQLREQVKKERTQNSNFCETIDQMRLSKTDIEMRFEKLSCDLKFARGKIDDLEKELALAKRKLFDHDMERRKLHNTIMDLKGNIRVFCRVRPSKNTMEKAVEVKDEDNLTLINRNFKRFNGTEVKSQCFKYDRVFTESSTQEEIFSEVELMVQSALDGYKVCIFAYGQTGSGKSYTMEGPPDVANNVEFFQDHPLRGVIPRAVERIFQSMPTFQKSGWQYTCECSFMEVYMERVYDLINNRQEVVLQNDGEQMLAKDLTVRPVFDKDDVDKLLVDAKRRRSTSATNRNEHSSRSHFLFQMNIIGTNDNGEKSYGRLNLIDLAGSENAKAAKDSEQKEEGTQIRQSLLALQRVLKNLKQGNNAAFRESKLTLLLRDSLVGSAKVLMFLNIAPEDSCIEETKNSLTFGSEVNSIQVGVAKSAKKGQ